MGSSDVIMVTNVFGPAGLVMGIETALMVVMNGRVVCIL